MSEKTVRLELKSEKIKVELMKLLFGSLWPTNICSKLVTQQSAVHLDHRECHKFELKLFNHYFSILNKKLYYLSN